MKSARERFQIAEEIIRRVDTVTLCTCDEAEDIHRRAQLGEFDDFEEIGDAPVAQT